MPPKQASKRAKTTTTRPDDHDDEVVGNEANGVGVTERFALCNMGGNGVSRGRVRVGRNGIGGRFDEQQ